MSATDGYCSATIERAAPVGADGVPGVIIPRGALEHLAHALKARPGNAMPRKRARGGLPPPPTKAGKADAPQSA